MRSKDRVRHSVRSSLFSGLALVLFAATLAAQPRKRPPAYFVQPRPPDQEEGKRILEKSRAIGLAGPYYFEFDLIIRPRSGEESTLSGRWFGSRNATGAITRIEIAKPDGGFETWLIQNGPDPAVWVADNSETGEIVDGEALLQTRLGTTISPIDLQLPFMYWTDHVYEGYTRFRGRPTHVFILYPSESWAGSDSEYAGVRVFIDTTYSALSQAQWVSEEGEPLKTITVTELKRVEETWIVKSFEVRDDKTRHKTRLVVKKVALNVPLPGRLFSPGESFAPGAVSIDSDRIVRIR